MRLISGKFARYWQAVFASIPVGGNFLLIANPNNQVRKRLSAKQWTVGFPYPQLSSHKVGPEVKRGNDSDMEEAVPATCLAIQVTKQ